MSRVWLIFLPITILLLSSCGPTNVAVQGEYPRPLTRKIPLDAGIIISPEFREHVYSDNSHGELNIDIGKAQTGLFLEIFEGMFQSSVEVKSIEESKTKGLDLTISPHVEDIQVALPQDTRLEVFEFWVRYNIQVFDEQGQPVADWVMTCYGKTMDQFMESKEAAINQAAVIALRDAGAQLVTRFHRAPGVKDWLKERLSNTSVEQKDEK